MLKSVPDPTMMGPITRDACAHLGQGDKTSSEGTSMYMYAPPRGKISVSKLFSRRTMLSILVPSD